MPEQPASDYKVQAWVKLIRGNVVPAFPRDVHIPRAIIEDRSAYEVLARHTPVTKPDFVSVYSEFERLNQIATTIYLDIDGEDLPDSLRWLTENYEVLSRLRAHLIFTGNRGFHVYIPLKPVKIDLKKATLFVVEHLLKDPDLIDKQKIGDWRAMGRLPYTTSEKSGGIVRPYPIQYNGIDATVDLSELLAQLFPAKLSGFKTSLPPENDLVWSCGVPPPCILSCMEHLRAGTITHSQRFHLTTFLLRILTPDEVTLVLSQALNRTGDGLSSRSMRQIEYSVRYLASKGYQPYNCYNCNLHGICPVPTQQESCPFYPSLNTWWS